MNSMLKKAVPVFASALLLAACGGGSKDSKSNGEGAKLVEFQQVLEQDGEAIKGGELKVALVSDSPITGIFNNVLYSANPDSQVLNYTAGAIFSVDNNFRFTNDGFGKFETDEEAKTVKVTFPKDAKWSDGEPMTIDDYIFTHEFIANKDYPGIRYPNYVGDVEGAEEYHNGSASNISGIEKIDDQTVILHYKDMTPSIFIAGGSLLNMVIPKHIFEGIPMDQVMESDFVRKHPVDFGPFKIDTSVAGESVTLVPNEYYWNGKAKIDRVIIEVVSSKNIVSEMENGNYDIADMPADQYANYKDASNMTILGTQDLAYTYIGFKLGKWDNAKSEVVTDPNAKMADKKLRQAMAYAVDNDKIAEKFYEGTRVGANSLIPPVFDVNNGQEGYHQDIEKANQLLDEAGYKYAKEGDEFRKDKDGNDLVINYATMAGGDNAETLAQAYIQWWHDIGLNVKLTTGRPIEFNSFYDKLIADDSEIDVFQAAWGTGADPNPTGLYGPKAAFNYTRFSTDEHTKLLEAIDSKESFDDKYRKEAFDKWQKYAHDEAFVIPTLFRTNITAVNNRVKNYSVELNSLPSKFSLNQLELLSDQRMK
ncbi:oligopeptide ABC transporter substrate-binding protein [Atopobacter phocae]|uniref:oligopeptide ABC transporter substrate-binding protein n=1 Tax=Atopobacter phocae TaxID=136492 RepID=UPI0004717B7A|nr:oligopeptide ABC transporter substrate-binding protein [Atopobacter phocae]